MSRLYPYAGFHVEYKMSTVWGRDYLVGVLKALDSRKTFMGCLVLSSTGQVGLIMITTIDLGYFIFLLIISPEFVKLVYVFKESIVCLILCVFVVLFSLNVINFFISIFIFVIYWIWIWIFLVFFWTLEKDH